MTRWSFSCRPAWRVSNATIELEPERGKLLPGISRKDSAIVQRMPDDKRPEAWPAALDAAQQQLYAAAGTTLEEHLRAVAQRRVDEELQALKDAGIDVPTLSEPYEVVVRRRPPS